MIFKYLTNIQKGSSKGLSAVEEYKIQNMVLFLCSKEKLTSIENLQKNKIRL